MKKYAIASALAASVFAPQAFAQAKNFEGFSVGGNINLNNTNFEQVPRSGGPSTTMSGSDSNLAVQAQYAFALGQQFVLGVGATLGLSDVKWGTWTNGVDAKMRNTTSLYVAPGFAVSDSALVYGKLAAISGNAYDNTGSIDLSGAGYGFGVQLMPDKHLYYQVEYMQNKYDDKGFLTVVDKFKNNVFTFGVGYKF